MEKLSAGHFGNYLDLEHWQWWGNIAIALGGETLCPGTWSN